jgi:hypothetical protein
MRQATTPKLVLLATTGFLLSILTLFFGTPFLRALRKTYGPIVFWSLGILLTALAFPIWFLVGTLWILIGVYEELVIRGRNFWFAALVSLCIGTGFGIASAKYTLHTKDIETKAQFEALVGEAVASLEATYPGIKVNIDEVIHLLPSLVIITLILALANAIIFERQVLNWFMLPLAKPSENLKLIEFRVPDFMIWIALTALLLSIWDFGYKDVGIFGMNVANVSAILYFFQGLAVMESYLRFVKAGFLLRFGTYFIIVGQLFLLLSILGLADFWVDFRLRMQKAASQSENS